MSRLALPLLALAFTLTATPVEAADPPFSERKISITARDQPASAFLTQFFGAAGMRVAVAGTVTGKINGRFSGDGAHIWDQIAAAFNLIAYYDGSVVTVFNSNDVQSRTVSVAPGRAGELASAVARARLPDDSNRVRVTSAESLMATGVPRFLDQVQQLGGALPRTALQGRPDVAAIQPARMQVPGGPAMVAPPPLPGQIEPYELRVFYLRYARADDTSLKAGDREIRIPGVATTLSRVMGDGQPIGTVAGSYGGQQIRHSQPRLMGRGLDATPADPSRGPSFGSPQEDEYLGLPPGAGAQQPQPQPVAQGGSPTGPRITVDPSLNAVVVRDRPENMPAYEGLVRSLDIAPQIVELEATIIDINVDRLRELGISWRAGTGKWSGLFGGDIVRRTGNPLTDGLLDAAGAANRGLSVSGIIGNNDFIARINALEQKGAARIVSHPQLVTLSDVEAVFDRTRTFYVRVAGDRQVDLFNVTAGTVLRVNPHVLVDNGQPRIRMVVNVEDGGTLSGDRVDRIPVVERASVNTQALIGEGESLLLGGLTVNSDLDAESSIPVLGKIPVLGELFKSRSKQRTHTERLFLISPRITRLDSTSTANAAPAPRGTELGMAQPPRLPMEVVQ